MDCLIQLDYRPAASKGSARLLTTLMVKCLTAHGGNAASRTQTYILLTHRPSVFGVKCYSRQLLRQIVDNKLYEKLAKCMSAICLPAASFPQSTLKKCKYIHLNHTSSLPSQEKIIKSTFNRSTLCTY